MRMRILLELLHHSASIPFDRNGCYLSGPSSQRISMLINPSGKLGEIVIAYF